MKFSIKDSFNRYDQICSFLWIWSHLFKKSLMENFIFCATILPEKFHHIGNRVLYTPLNLDYVTFGTAALSNVYIIIGQARKFIKKTLLKRHLIKKKLWHRCFPVNFVKFLGTTFLYIISLGVRKTRHEKATSINDLVNRI